MTSYEDSSRDEIEAVLDGLEEATAQEVYEATLQYPARALAAVAAARADAAEELRRTEVTLTDAQIKALPSTPVTVLTPPAGKIALFMRAVFKLDDSGGVYTNSSGLSAYFLLQELGSGLEVSCYVILPDLGAQAAVSLTPAVFEKDEGYLPLTSGLGVSGGTGRAIQVAAQNGLGNFTGGNAANTLRITVFYVLVDV